MSKTVLISNWKELSKLPDSKTHKLKITPSDGNGWLINKKTSDSEYLSTHTFYGSIYESSTKVLQSAGFNVQLKNWDEGLEK